ncbi:helix-turn-helix transcriptional regulator, partial [Streptomyces sp. NPDC051132]|uniref:helix-turn-helix domain-containing protein n=1 Tax=Streptomyces sp. NPDC051132 TaxID=3155667 RepID=UPI003435F76F
MAEAEAALRTLAHNVRAARTRAGLSLDELGRRAKVSKGALVGLEKAQGNPNFATLVRLADTLGVSVSALLEGPAPLPDGDLAESPVPTPATTRTPAPAALPK